MYLMSWLNLLNKTLSSCQCAFMFKKQTILTFFKKFIPIFPITTFQIVVKYKVFCLEAGNHILLLYDWLDTFRKLGLYLSLTMFARLLEISWVFTFCPRMIICILGFKYRILQYAYKNNMNTDTYSITVMFCELYCIMK